MKLDAELKERLHAEAERLDPDAPPVKRMARRARRRTRMKRAGALLSVVALLGGAGVVGSYVLRSPDAAFSPLLERRAADRRTSLDITDQAEEPVPQPTQGPAGEFDELFRDQPAFIAPPGDAAPEPAEPSTQAAPGEVEAGPTEIGVGPKIVKTADIALEVRDGTFPEAFSNAEGIADQHGGFIISSSTSGQEARSGELTIRVPSEQFEEALAALKSVGILRSEQVDGQDVTADFVDLQARLRHAQIQERFFLTLLREADSISESISVNRQLQESHLVVERLKGQLRLLRDQTSLGTITVRVHEKGVAPESKDQPNELASAWGRAIEGAEDVLVAVIVGLGYLVPILVVLLIIWLGLRTVRSRMAT
jgi:Domain of unknown function (DUF4349)